MMQIDCPTCKAKIEQHSNPVRGPDNTGNEAWVCLWCDTIVCTCCYPEHTQKKHPPNTEKPGQKNKGNQHKKKK